MSAGIGARAADQSNRWRTLVMLCSMSALAALLFGRMLGPSDLWDQTQPKTVSYTTDIIVHGGLHWILPIERGELPATKPPLYNWLAVPMVRWLGFNNEIAHRFPSIVAICLCWLIVVRLGRSIAGQSNETLGWLAGLALATNASMFKLGYLVRPDMLLTLWLTLGWVAATVLLIDGESLSSRRRGWLTFGFWMCIALSALTKGPAAMVLPVYSVIAARVLRGSWRSARILKLQWGIPLTTLIVGAWVYGVWRINPDHLVKKLWGDEIYGRVTGLGPEGNRNGPIGFIKDMPEQALFFIVRFLPWSIPAMAAMWPVIRRLRIQSNAGPDAPKLAKTEWAWPLAATVQVLVVVGLFTLSTGKRADYIAGAFPPGAILAAWWLLRCGPKLAIRAPWLAPAVASIAMVAMIVVNHMELPPVPQRGFGEAIRRFADQATDRMAQEPLPGGLVFCWSGETHLQAMLGSSQLDGKEAVVAAIDKGEPFWAVAGLKTSEPHEFGEWLRTRRDHVRVESIISSAQLPRDLGWPEQVTLYRVTP